MTQIEISQEASPPQPSLRSEPATVIEPTIEPPVEPPPAPAEPGPSMGRLVGVDLARALAVFGMFVVHVGPPAKEVGGLGGWLLELASGRSSVLFATLAGFSLMLIAGRFEPKTGRAGRQAKARIAIRAVILLALGTALTMMGTGIFVILAYYGVYFLLALPLLRLRATTLAITAAVLAVVAPQVAFARLLWLSESLVDGINAYDPIAWLSGDGVLDLLLDGFYPAITWMPFVITGMALSRLDLAAGAVQRRLAALGSALIVLGYGTPWLVFRLFSSLREAAAAQEAIPAAAAGKALAASSGSGSLGSVAGDMPVDLDGTAWLALLTAEPHSGTTFDILGSLGAAIIVLVGATAAMARLPRLRWAASPVIAVGTMSLTVYVGHIAAYALLPAADSTSASLARLAGFIIAAILFAVVWSRFFRRGPLEYLLNGATKLARFVR